MRRVMTRGRVSVTAALALLVGACALAGDGAGSEGESIDDFIPGGPMFSDENWEGDYRRQELAAQEAVAECMAKEGFEYIPYLPNYDEGGFGEPETEEEYIQEYGLGISYYVLSQEFYGEDASDLEDGTEHAVPDEVAANPNMAIREAMSEDQREAYDEALWGVYPESEYDDMTEEEYEAMSEDELDAMFEEQDALMEGWESGGCYDEANEELWDAGAFETFHEQFGNQLEEIYEEVEADPRIVELDSKWSKCMSGAGYTFDDEEDATSYVVGLLEEVGAVSIPANPQGVWDYAPKPIEAGTDTYREVESIFKEEVAIAEASLKCRGGAYEIYETVYKEYEQAFIDNNRAALEQFREENS